MTTCGVLTKGDADCPDDFRLWLDGRDGVIVISFEGGIDDGSGLGLCGSCLISTRMGVDWIDEAGWDTVVAGAVTAGKVLCCGAPGAVKDGSI